MRIKILVILTLLASALSAFSQEKMVHVNGVNYHVLTKSLEQRKPGQPVFFVGGKLEVPMERRSKEYDHERFFEVKNSSNMLRWRRFMHASNKGGALIYLTNSGHFVHRDDAAMVIGNIRMMLKALEK